jgi:flagellar hook assembly protein FlgD
MSASPNPFSGGTRISFTVPVATRVSLRIYDVSGRLVENLVDGPVSAGSHNVQWDGMSSDGSRVAPGIYMSILQVEGERVVRKLSLLP